MHLPTREGRPLPYDEISALYGRGGVAVKGDMVYRLSEHMVYKYRYSLIA